MKTLDWYILKSFLKTFFFLLVIFSMITLAIDASEKSEDFVRSGLGFSDIVTKYYYGFLPHIIGLLFPVFVLIAVVFFTSKLAIRSEIVAMLSVGMSLNRILRPYWVGGIFLALVLALSNHFLIPVANVIRTNFENRYVDMGNIAKQQRQYLNNIHFRVDTYTYAGMRNYDTSAKIGNGFFLEKVKDNQVYYNLRSETIIWDTAKKHWKLENAIERKINGLKEEVRTLSNYSLKMGYLPTDISEDEFKKDKLKTPALNRFIKQEEIRGSEGVNAIRFERYRRDSYAIAVIIMTMIAAILASRKIRGGSGFHLALAFIIGVLYIIIDKFSMVFSTKGNLPPFLAAWIPNVIFALVALHLYKRAPK
jgi:lipopolysaccharide export system permease protein